MTIDSLKTISKEIRLDILEAIIRAKSAHIGSCFSIVDILTVLYFSILKISPNDPYNKSRDIFILSKGHAVVALYAILAKAGFFDHGQLAKYGQDGSKLAGHVTKGSVPGIEISTGSLGHGLPIISGLAWAGKKEGNNRKYYCLLGDGECNEGSVWEAVMFGAQNKLNNLTVIVDFNKQQGMGVSEKIINQNNLVERWQSFGWDACEVDGHDFKEMIKALESKRSLKPKVIIAKTIKGKGVSFMEDSVDWHYKTPNTEQHAIAIQEINNFL